MKNIFFFIILLSQFSYAQTSEIFKCRASNETWNAVFILDTVGGSFLQFQKASDSNTYTCGLKLLEFADLQRAVSPVVRMDFERGECSPELGQLKNELFEKFSISIDVTKKEQLKSRVQWLRKKQVDNCVVERMSLVDVSQNAKKWVEGRWGRKTASEPNELKRNELKKTVQKKNGKK